MRSEVGFRKFETILNHLDIPHNRLPRNMGDKLNNIFEQFEEEAPSSSPKGY